MRVRLREEGRISFALDVRQGAYVRDHFGRHVDVGSDALTAENISVEKHQRDQRYEKPRTEGEANIHGEFTGLVVLESTDDGSHTPHCTTESITHLLRPFRRSGPEHGRLASPAIRKIPDKFRQNFFTRRLRICLIYD